MHAPEGDGELHDDPPGTAAKLPAAPSPHTLRLPCAKNVAMATFPHTPMPEQGLPRDEVMQRLLTMKQDDQDWRGGRVFSLVYSAGNDVHELLSDALALYSAENGLNVLAFPSIGVMQHDIVSNTATLLGADDPAAGGAVEGYLTSGGTESLLQAVKTARDVGRTRGMARPSVVAAESAHAAFTKAADYFDVELVRVPVDADFRVRAEALADACTDDTIMVVGSAPTYPHGVIDPVADIAALALDRGILCHVDACMGGFLLPFLAELGRLDEPFDFRVPGVTSMSADVHKYGYASKGVSVILYRTHELARMQLFVTTDWLGGFYASTAMAGTRPAGPVAAAWAALMHIGRAGYREPPAPRTTRPGSCGPAWSPSTAWRCAATRRRPCWPSVPKTLTPSTSSPWASGSPRRAGTSTVRTGPTRSTPRCTPAARPPCPRS